MRSRRLFAATALVALATAAQGIAGGSDLHKILLRPAQVGSGYRLQPFEHGDEVANQVSLDLCDLRFASESLRVARLQVAYLHGGGVTQVSNELVRYKPGGARQALRELRAAASHCPRAPVKQPGGGSVTYRLTRVSDRRLLPDSLAVRMHVAGTFSGEKFDMTVLAVYQIRGDLLSAIYTDGSGNAASELRVGLHAAEQSAINLKSVAP